MTAYALSRRAESDLDEIWDYSAEHWGREHANRYVEGLWDTIRRLALDPSRGRSVTVKHMSYYRYGSGSHMIFYRRTDQGIYVVRILHQRMDFLRHLP